MINLRCIKIKVNVKSHGIYPWISCPLHISYTTGRIFINVWSNVHLSKLVSNDSATQTQSQGHD